MPNLDPQCSGQRPEAHKADACWWDGWIDFNCFIIFQDFTHTSVYEDTSSSDPSSPIPSLPLVLVATALQFSHTMSGTSSSATSVAQLCLTLCDPWTPTHQSMGFPRQEYWIGLPCPSPEDLPNPEVEPESPVSPALAGRFFTTGGKFGGRHQIG